MTESMMSFVVGIVVVGGLVIFTAVRYRREHKDRLNDQPVSRWLHAHPLKDWLHHKH